MMRNLIVNVPRPEPTESEQHLRLDKGYVFADVHHFVGQERYAAHIKHRRRNESSRQNSVPGSPLGR